MTTDISLIIDANFLAREINDAHGQVKHHARSMLLEAKRAGDALIAAKKMVKHGEFKTWVETHTSVSDRTAQVYMRVARLSKTADLCAFEGHSIAAFVEAHSTPRRAEPSAPPKLARKDAEHAIKLHQMAVSDNPNEADVAARKLDAFATQFGMIGEEVVSCSEEMLGLNGEPLSPMDQAAETAISPYCNLPKKKLLDVIHFCMAEHPDLIQTLREQFQ